MGRILKSVVLLGVLVQLAMPQAALGQDYYDDRDDGFNAAVAAALGFVAGVVVGDSLDSQDVDSGHYRDRREIPCKKVVAKRRDQRRSERGQLVTLCYIRGEWRKVSSRNYIATNRGQRFDNDDYRFQRRPRRQRRDRRDDYRYVQPRQEFRRQEAPGIIPLDGLNQSDRSYQNFDRLPPAVIR